MAYANSNNNKKKDYSPTVYSAVRMTNVNSQIDKTSLSFSYWKQLLAVSITPYKGNDFANGSYPELDLDHQVKIYLSPSRTIMLLRMLDKFLADPKAFSNMGIPTNKGIIYFSNGEEYNRPGIYLVIKLIDFATGETKTMAAYEFAPDSEYFGITNYNDQNDFGRDDTVGVNVEIELFKQVLKNYLVNCDGSVAGCVLDNLKYDITRINNKLDAIMENLGISKHNNGGSSNYGQANSYWNNGGGGNSRAASSDDNIEKIEDLDSLVDDIANMQ